MKKLVLILFSLSCSISYCQNSDDDKNLKESLEELNRLELMAKRQFEENGFTATEYSNEIARISRYRKQIIDLDSFYIDSFLGFKFGMSIETCADENYNEDDIRLAIGRTFMNKLGIDT